jgi:hypothetical protein
MASRQGRPALNGDVIVSPRGVDPSTLTLADRLLQIVFWPLKRQLFVQPFKVIARVGSTGSDETVLEPDDEKRSNNLDVTITPKRDGELSEPSRRHIDPRRPNLQPRRGES